MKKKSKRILALVLVLALAFTSFAMLASASEADVEERDAYSCPVCKLVLQHTTKPKDGYTYTTTCNRISTPHAHYMREVYNAEFCLSCGYYSESFAYYDSRCLG